MPELHKNQIEWSAPEPQKVSLVKPDYTSLAQASNALSRAFDEFSQYQAHIDDVDAKEKLNLASANGLSELDKEQVSDANYDRAFNKFKTNLITQFDSFDEATRNRFMRDNPTYFEEQELKAKEIIFDKQQKFAITKIKNLIPLLSSNVTEGAESYEDVRKKLDNMVAKVDNVTAEELINDFDRRVQVGNLQNLVARGQYSDAITILENPKESDKLYPEERISEKVAIQKMIKEETKARETMRAEAIKDINSATEKGLVNTLLIQLDRKDTSYGETLRLLDDPSAKVPLMNADGEIEAYVTAKDIPVEIRRDALKKARTYEEDSMSYRVNSLKAKELAQNFEIQYKTAKGKRTSGEMFNNVYDFTQSAEFYYLGKEDQEKMFDIVYGEVNRYNEQVIPYSDIRSQNLLYGTIDQWSGPSGPLAVRQYVFGRQPIKTSDKKPSMIGKTVQTQMGVFTPGLASITRLPNVEDAFSDQRIGYDQLTANLKSQYEKDTNKEVKDGSTLEFLMNTYAALLSYTPKERAAVGLGNSSDEQIGLTFARMKGMLEATGQDGIILGQNMTNEQAESSRKKIFEDFYILLNNGEKSTLTKEQTETKQKFYNSVRDGSYGVGGKLFGAFDESAYRQVENNKIYPKPLTNEYNKQLKRENK